jgi:4-hydroxybenzoate polyprenyltransferase
LGEQRVISEFLKLFRLQTGATTALAPVIGYLVLAAQTGYKILLVEIFLIFVIGILMHIFEFVLNEYIDVEVDRRSPDLAEKPLVKGSVSLNAALGVVVGALIFSYVIAILFFFNLWTLIFLTLAFQFGAIYDIHGKRFAGSDVTLGLWILFFCLFGASIVSRQFTGILYLVAGLGFFQILFNNAIEGGLKDADHDATAGACTLAYVLGVRVRNRRLIIPNTFKFASYAIKLAHITIIFILIYLAVIKINTFFDYIHLIIILFLIIIIFFTLNEFLSHKKFQRDKLKRIFSVHEIATFYLAPILLLQLIGFIPVICLLILPLVWYIVLNLALYGKPLEPRV